VGARERPHGERSWPDPEGRRRGTPRGSKQLKPLWLRTVTPGAEAADRLLSTLASRRLGHATRVAARIVRCCFDRRGRQGLRCVGKQLGRVVWHRLIRINRIRLREWRNHGMCKPARLRQLPIVHRDRFGRDWSTSVGRADRSARPGPPRRAEAALAPCSQEPPSRPSCGRRAVAG
jgi:hypothetical protein